MSMLLSLIYLVEQMENLSVMPPVEGQELLQGAVLMVQSHIGCCQELILPS